MNVCSLKERCGETLLEKRLRYRPPGPNYFRKLIPSVNRINEAQRLRIQAPLVPVPRLTPDCTRNLSQQGLSRSFSQLGLGHAVGTQKESGVSFVDYVGLTAKDSHNITLYTLNPYNLSLPIAWPKPTSPQMVLYTWFSQTGGTFVRSL